MQFKHYYKLDETSISFGEVQQNVKMNSFIYSFSRFSCFGYIQSHKKKYLNIIKYLLW
jgi:hypothetical protein